MADHPSRDAFLDTNAVIHALAGGDDPSRQVTASSLNHGAVISIQVLNEFVHTVLRKLRDRPDEINEAGCMAFLTEEMHDGLVVSGRLTVSNPFVPLRQA